MNHHVNAIFGRLSLHPPQRRSLEILDRLAEISSRKKGAEMAAALKWCKNATDYSNEHWGKPWAYVLISLDALAVNMTIEGLAGQWT